jgi:signal transduction histidine kinase
VLAALGAVALGLTVLTLLFNVLLAGRLSADATQEAKTAAQAELANLNYEHGRLSVEETPQDGQLSERVWVLEGKRVLERPPASATVLALAEGMAQSRASVHEVKDDLRLVSQVFSVDGHRRGTVVAEVSLVPYEHTQHLALISSLVLDLVILLMVAVVARQIVGVALRPVARMTAQAAQWSEQDLDRRFALGPARDELTALAATLDALLGRLGASLRHEQRFTAEIAHEVRTPLAALRTEAELALRRERTSQELRGAITEVLFHAQRISQVVDTLMAAAERSTTPSSATVSAIDAAEAAVGDFRRQAASRGIEMQIRPAEQPIEVNTDERMAARILAPVLENAIRYGHSKVSIELAHDGPHAVFAVLDDGPGVGAQEAERLFEPGVRGRSAGAWPGAGLGLSLARRLARSTGGDITACPAVGSGRFEIRLPAS